MLNGDLCERLVNEPTERPYRMKVRLATGLGLSFFHIDVWHASTILARDLCFHIGVGFASAVLTRGACFLFWEHCTTRPVRFVVAVRAGRTTELNLGGSGWETPFVGVGSASSALRIELWPVTLRCRSPIGIHRTARCGVSNLHDFVLVNGPPVLSHECAVPWRLGIAIAHRPSGATTNRHILLRRGM